MKKLIDFVPVIGFEIHIELATRSKMFCACPAWHFQVKPNTNCCPVCLGLPGSLPVANFQAIEMCLITGLALNCKILPFSKFDRKNYFYPDLAKGYQISQYDLPFCKNGAVSLEGKKIGIERVHLEEDTAKMIHKNEETLIDFNRSGVALMEIVTKPDLVNSDQARDFLKKLQQIVRYLGVSNCDMEKGSMRCEANVSLRSKNSDKLPNYKVEIKNVNSFRFVKKAIDYEIERQAELLTLGKKVVQETRGFDEKTGKTLFQRTKEEAHDYCYFPEPDIPPFKFSKDYVKKLKRELPGLPDEELERRKGLLSSYNAKILTDKKKLGGYYDEVLVGFENEGVKVDRSLAAMVANIVINKRVNISKVSPKCLAEQIVRGRKKAADQVSDRELEEVIEKVLEKNAKAVADYKKGKEQAIMFLVGQVMGEIGGRISAKKIVDKIKSTISK